MASSLTSPQPSAGVPPSPFSQFATGGLRAFCVRGPLLPLPGCSRAGPPSRDCPQCLNWADRDVPGREAGQDKARPGHGDCNGRAGAWFRLCHPREHSIGRRKPHFSHGLGSPVACWDPAMPPHSAEGSWRRGMARRQHQSLLAYSLATAAAARQ